MHTHTFFPPPFHTDTPATFTSAAMKCSVAAKKNKGTRDRRSKSAQNTPSSANVSTQPHRREVVLVRKVKMVCVVCGCFETRLRSEGKGGRLFCSRGSRIGGNEERGCLLYLSIYIQTCLAEDVAAGEAP